MNKVTLIVSIMITLLSSEAIFAQTVPQSRDEAEERLGTVKWDRHLLFIRPLTAKRHTKFSVGFDVLYYDCPFRDKLLRIVQDVFSQDKRCWIAPFDLPLTAEEWPDIRVNLITQWAEDDAGKITWCCVSVEAYSYDEPIWRLQQKHWSDADIYYLLGHNNTPMLIIPSSVLLCRYEELDANITRVLKEVRDSALGSLGDILKDFGQEP